MAFTKTNMQYRITLIQLLTVLWRLMHKGENNDVAFGDTIEQAVRALNESGMRSEPFQMATDEISENQ